MKMNFIALYQENHEVIIGGVFTLLGLIIAWLLNFIQSYYQNKKEQKIHLREKREEVYLRVIDVLTRHEKCYREKSVTEEEYEEYKKAFNDLQSYMMVYAAPTIYKEYYKLCGDIMNSYVNIKRKKDREHISEANASKIEAFADKIRKELGVEGNVSSR